mmetsp:Transcript_69549/g.165881  ORF Transcript_69549/g.165881 Transcript_69549/m.165881 type:complete len:256 (+) Transcript_69549:57-824(+)|eukprot:CAMPEP_0181412686 /NCGR_PEP_ID=MMETSP1110-20121109/8560_1 /TAXON_ID=174948 /ORGANISM="Symbiodinium sp., Strain CCMP421" /LENGTH=255 /DNA_ID=CAMNT_0023535427 /DNA_START=44 /DNA_END=811 /DNA_ORIENTATION=+
MPSVWRVRIWRVIFIAAFYRAVYAIRDESLGDLDSAGAELQKRGNASKAVQHEHRAVSNSSLVQEKRHADSVDPLAVTVVVAEQSIMKGMELQVRAKQHGVCPEELTIPPTPGIQLRPDWLYGLGCGLDHGKLCRCPWRGIYGCQRSGMFGLPGGLSTDLIQKMGFCRIEAWVFIFPPVALVGAFIYFMPASSSSREQASQEEDATSRTPTREGKAADKAPAAKAPAAKTKRSPKAKTSASRRRRPSESNSESSD